MYLFILESIGTSELILIGIVALIVFGPRKLPQMAKTFGKMMAEFRSATNEFKTTWQKEASFEEESNQIKNFFQEPAVDNNVSVSVTAQNEISNKAILPEVREVDVSEIKKRFELEIKPDNVQNDKSEIGKRDWL